MKKCFAGATVGLALMVSMCGCQQQDLRAADESAASAATDAKPVVTISAPSVQEAKEGESISFTLTYSDDIGIETINTTEGHIGLYGFTGDVDVFGTGMEQRTVKISNIRGVGDEMYITVNSGAAVDTSMQLSEGVTSDTFAIVSDEAATDAKPVVTISAPSVQKAKEGESISFTLTYSDDIGIKTINTTEGHIGLYGFSGDVDVYGTGKEQRTVKISNIRGVGDEMYITVTSGAAVDTSMQLSEGVTSETFTIVLNGAVTDAK